MSQETKSDTENQQVEKVATLKLGDPAPFTGTLFSTAATAKLLTELQLCKESCDLRIGRAVEENTASFQLQLDRLKINHKTEKQICESKIQIRDGQIEFLQKRYEPTKWYEHPAFWVTIGLVVGAGTTIGITYAVNTP